MTKRYMICPKCGRKWRCREGEDCEHFVKNPSTCPCDVCYHSYDVACEEVELFDEKVKKEVVLFT